MAGNVLYTNTLNTFYLQLYTVGHMVEDHYYSEKEIHGLLFLISSKGSFICIAHTTAFVTPVVEHWLEREAAQWVHQGDLSDDLPHHERMLYHRSTSQWAGRYWVRISVPSPTYSRFLETITSSSFSLTSNN